MLKISNFKIEEGLTFQIRNSWRDQIVKLLKKEDDNYPFSFKVCEKILNDDKSIDYYCESVIDLNKKIYKIVVSETIIRYLLGTEVDDCNVGLYFTDYLPLENSKLLIEDCKNKLNISPVNFCMSLKLNTLNKSKIPYLDFVLDNLILNESYKINYFSKGSWKFLKGSDIYMTDVEKMYQDTFIHKELVYMVCSKFSDYLKENGLEDDSIKLMERAIVHDNSKILNDSEFHALTGIINDKSCLKDASSKLSLFKQDSIELHWKHNSHHPEHFEDYSQMSRIDRLEMVCDWTARALQYKTDLLEFVQKRQEDRFHFSELMFDEIYHYCKIVLDLLKND